ncbi:MAG: radical SAM protein, partial [Candidatus Omnitrophica bacterium]|nr:radical SAM protein [Candidatus Omnitrophota bacterium]
MLGKVKVKLVSVEEGITALGFRRIVSIARKFNPDSQVYFLTVGNLYSFATHFFPSNHLNYSDNDFDSISGEFADADILCFSSMTASAFYIEKIIQYVKKKNPKVFVLWGGAHAIIYPDQAIKHADAICTGEGEYPFDMFYRAFTEGKDYSTTPSMWFNTGKGIVKNKNRRLDTPEELSYFPHLYYGLDCSIFDLRRRIFRRFTQADYINYNSLSYRTVWSIGCPFSCAYCANDVFLSNDKDYGWIRYPSVDYIISEIEKAIAIYPFISTVIFYDDSFIGIPLDDIKAFAHEYKKRINLPFLVAGIHPNFVTREKINLLAEAGMNRTRMGIQSASEKTLSFYRRFTSLSKIKESAKILSEATRHYGLIPPAYDIISDNPVESREDIVDTLMFLYELDRPYTLTIFSLRIFPYTKLWDYFRRQPEMIDLCGQTNSYLQTKKNIANILLYILAVMKPPKAFFYWVLRFVKGGNERQSSHPVFYLLVKGIYLSSRAF